MDNLWVVLPVYNEEDCIEQVVNEWLPMFRKASPSFTLCILNDGSKDNTPKIIDKLATLHKELKIVHKTNSGHGQTCMLGYKLGIENKAEWIFQMDSDGQCDPKYFEHFVTKSKEHQVIYGFRKTREDGFKRWLVSRVVTWFVWVATGAWVRDANVPYRLMHKDAIATIITDIPKDFYLANILVAVLQQKKFKIQWVNIHFRERAGGEPSVKTFTFAKHGFKLFKQLRQVIRRD
jgi:glycosyltransferase involved in cell wall biosynthesis